MQHIRTRLPANEEGMIMNELVRYISASLVLLLGPAGAFEQKPTVLNFSPP
jgi:hypothetical protein